jgi:hypothetical protein
MIEREGEMSRATRQRRLATQQRPHLGVERRGIIGFDDAELQFVGCRRRIAGVNSAAVDQLIAPHPGNRERPGNRAADTAGVVFDDEFTQCRQRHFR